LRGSLAELAPIRAETRRNLIRKQATIGISRVAGMLGYRVESVDGEIGYVEDLLCVRRLTVRYILLTHGLVTGRKLLAPPSRFNN